MFGFVVVLFYEKGRGGYIDKKSITKSVIIFSMLQEMGQKQFSNDI